MALKACCGSVQNRASVRALAALGLPTEAEGRQYHYSFLSHCSLPKLFLSGDRDQYAPAAQLARIVDSAAAPKRLLLIPGADHFFTRQLEAMQQALCGWLKEQL
jgi:alpha/beta superfamily hydrolase